MLGTAPWLVVAGLIEGFVTPARLGVVPAALARRLRRRRLVLDARGGARRSRAEARDLRPEVRADARPAELLRPGLDHDGTGAAQLRGGPLTRRKDVERDRRAVHVAGTGRLGADHRLEV